MLQSRPDTEYTAVGLGSQLMRQTAMDKVRQKSINARICECASERLITENRGAAKMTTAAD